MDYQNTKFDDDAVAPVTGGVAPFWGSYQPEGVLADFNGVPMNGTWTLWISDDYAIFDFGTLNSWSISVSHP